MSNPSDLGHIGVLMGGCSSEREISLKSGHAIVRALSDEGCQVSPVEIDTCDAQSVAALLIDGRVDVAFIALHGTFGEDGGIQQILEDRGVPYTGSDAKTSRVAINKVLTQNILQQKKILVPPHCSVQEGEGAALKKIEDIFGAAGVVVKPACEGSSIGITIVRERRDLPAALKLAFSYGKEVLAEQYVVGRELTAGILDGQALPLVEIRPKSDFFDFTAKYEKGLTEYIVPAPVPEATGTALQQAALKACQVLGCRDLARVDFILDPGGRPFLLEVNTIPGFTETSLLPKAAWHVGISFGELCLKIAYLAAARRIAHLKN